MTHTVKNWSRFQHYKNRRPPWIKLYRELLDDPEYHALPAAAAKALPLIWLIASEANGALPASNVLAWRLRVSESDCLTILAALSHWVTPDASNMLAPCKQHASAEREREGETEREKDALASTSQTSHLRATLCHLFSRPPDAPWDDYEGGLLVPVGRSTSRADIDLFAAWFAGLRGDDRKTLPQSIRAALDRWTSHMDRARGWKRPAGGAPDHATARARERAAELAKKVAAVRSYADDPGELARLEVEWAADWPAIQAAIRKTD